MPKLTAGTSPVMNIEMYSLLDKVSDTYWRYVARHRLFFNLWMKHRGTYKEDKVLDIGCGSGGLLAYIARRASITPIGIDLFAGTLSFCQKRGINAVSAADAIALPFRENTFDFVIAQDVIEHIEDDIGALQEMYRVCATGGVTLILVPAFNFLWSTRDVELRHYRRYTLDQLLQRTQAVGFTVLHSTYIDLILLPLLYTALQIAPRNAQGLAQLDADTAPGNSGIINQLALLVAHLEGRAASAIGLPFGVAAVVLARK